MSNVNSRHSLVSRGSSAFHAEDDENDKDDDALSDTQAIRKKGLKKALEKGKSTGVCNLDFEIATLPKIK